MKILFVIPTLGTGGAERVATILANHFIKKHVVEILVMEKSAVESYPVDPTIKINEIGIEVRRGNKFRAVANFCVTLMRQRNMLLMKIKQYKPDIVISFLPKADILVYTIYRRNGFRWISSERNDPMSRNKIERLLLNQIYKKVDVLVCQTNKISEFYKGKGIKRRTVIRNPIVCSEPEKIELGISFRYLIAVGRLDRQKNYEMLIQAFSMVKNEIECPEKLLILGVGPEEEKLKSLIKKLNMSSEIKLLGRKNNVSDYLRGAEAFVMSSNYEGLPNSLIEAMAVGLPVISTDFFTGAAAELIDESNGFLVPVGEIEKMKIAISKMVTTSQGNKLSMGDSSLKKVKEMDVTKIVEEWNYLMDMK